MKDNPIDYFKFVYVLFTTVNNSPKNIPQNIAMDITFEALYPVIRMYIPDTLYKFYSLTNDDALNERKFDTLKNKKIFMSDIKDFNDPFDGKAFFYNPVKLKDIERLKKYNGRFIDDFTTFHKGTALTENGPNCMPMWAHYANNHQGYCIAYDMKNPLNISLSGCTFPMQYTDERLDITSFIKQYACDLALQVDNFTSKGINKIPLENLSLVYVTQLLTNIKHSSWSYEKEFRCTMAASAKGIPFVDAIPQKIYVGMNCSEANRSKLMSIAKELSVPIYQMHFCETSDNYSLEEILLDT